MWHSEEGGILTPAPDLELATETDWLSGISQPACKYYFNNQSNNGAPQEYQDRVGQVRSV